MVCLIYLMILLTGFRGRCGVERQILDANPRVRACFLQLEEDLHARGVAAGRVRQGRQGIQRLGAAVAGRKSACCGEHGALELQSVWVLIACVSANSFQEILFSLQIQRSLRELIVRPSFGWCQLPTCFFKIIIVEDN